MEALANFLGMKKRQRIDAKRSAWDQYRDLLKAFVDGREVDVEEADAILADVGRTEAELQRDVETFQERLRARDELDAAIKAPAEVEDCERQLAELDQQIEDLRAKLQPKVDRLLAKRQEAQRRRERGQWAERALLTTVIDPAIKEVEADLKERLKELSERQRTLESNIADLRLGYYERELEYQRDRHSSDSDKVAEAQRHVEIARRQVEPLRDQLSPIVAEADQIRSQLEELRERKLTP